MLGCFPCGFVLVVLLAWELLSVAQKGAVVGSNGVVWMVGRNFVKLVSPSSWEELWFSVVGRKGSRSWLGVVSAVAVWFDRVGKVVRSNDRKGTTEVRWTVIHGARSLGCLVSSFSSVDSLSLLLLFCFSFLSLFLLLLLLFLFFLFFSFLFFPLSW